MEKYIVFCQFDGFKRFVFFVSISFHGLLLSWNAFRFVCGPLWFVLESCWLQCLFGVSFLKHRVSTLLFTHLSAHFPPITNKLLFTKCWEHFPDLISLNLFMIFGPTYHFLLKTLCCLAFWDTTSSCFSTFSCSVYSSPPSVLLWPSPQTPLKVISFTSL